MVEVNSAREAQCDQIFQQALETQLIDLYFASWFPVEKQDLCHGILTVPRYWRRVGVQFQAGHSVSMMMGV
jgi:hypothetical protein